MPEIGRRGVTPKPFVPLPTTKGQIAIMRFLANTPGLHTRERIAAMTGVSQGTAALLLRTEMSQIAELAKQGKVECRSLVSLGYVEELKLNIDGITELAYRLTKEGKALGY